MAIPLVPLFAGAVIGGLVTYIYKDEKTRSAVSRTADDVSDKVKDTASSISGKVSDGVGSLKGKFSKRSAVEEESDIDADLELQSAVIEDPDSEIDQGDLIDSDESDKK